MKYDPAQHGLQRILDLVARETGHPLGASGTLELDGILQELNGIVAPRGAMVRQEFRSREVTILLADLRGFTAIAAAHPAGVVIQLLNACFIRLSEIIFRHHGTIDKFMGDSIMVLFGAPTSHDDDVKRAVACAVEMQIAMSELNLAHKERGMPELFLGIGINTGTVLAGTLGSERYSEYTVIGDEVNLASRIEAFSLRGQVLISQSTYERCGDFIETNEPMDIHVKGKSQPVSLREVAAIPSLGVTVPRQEIRRSHRIEVNLPLSCQLLEGKIVMPETHAGTLRDIGYHGALVEMNGAVPLRSEIKLNFDLPLVLYPASNIYGKVLSERFRDTVRLLGIEFTSVPPDVEAKIQLFVQLLVFRQ